MRQRKEQPFPVTSVTEWKTFRKVYGQEAYTQHEAAVERLGCQRNVENHVPQPQ